MKMTWPEINRLRVGANYLNVCAEAEVGDLDAAIRAKQDVVGLDVAVQDSAFM